MGPARPGDRPRPAAESTRTLPNELAAPEANVAAAPTTPSATVARPARVAPARRAKPGNCRGTAASVVSAATAAATNAQRQPAVSAMVGTATPASRVETGMAACLTPNDSPCRREGTCWASAALLANWPSAFAAALSASRPTSTGYDRAKAATASIDPAASRMPQRATTAGPYRSTNRPEGTEASALTPK
ncbi:hypothetical protein ONO86_02508 [Micromonospora noduli]|nr:hypothetical protein ONO86_02508 [Micromonospora noduli]